MKTISFPFVWLVLLVSISVLIAEVVDTASQGTAGDSGIPPAPQGPWGRIAPTNLIQRIRLGDNILITNVMEAGHYGNFSMHLAGPDARDICTAVSGVWTYTNAPNSSATCAWELRFYRGTNYLETARFQEYVLRYDSRDYREDTGVLEKLYDNILQRAEPSLHR